MQSQHLYPVTNVQTKLYFNRFFETNLDTALTVQSGTLHITTYGQVRGSLFIDEQSPHVVAVQYDLKTGKTISDHASFRTKHGAGMVWMESGKRWTCLVY